MLKLRFHPDGDPGAAGAGDPQEPGRAGGQGDPAAPASGEPTDPKVKALHEDLNRERETIKALRKQVEALARKESEREKAGLTAEQRAEQAEKRAVELERKIRVSDLLDNAIGSLGESHIVPRGRVLELAGRLSCGEGELETEIGKLVEDYKRPTALKPKDGGGNLPTPEKGVLVKKPAEYTVQEIKALRKSDPKLAEDIMAQRTRAATTAR